MSFGGCFWALSFCFDWRNKTCFGETATMAKVKIGPLWSKIKKLDKKMFLWTKKSFSPEICVHWIKVVGQETPKYTVWSFKQTNSCVLRVIGNSVVVGGPFSSSTAQTNSTDLGAGTSDSVELIWMKAMSWGGRPVKPEVLGRPQTLTHAKKSFHSLTP